VTLHRSGHSLKCICQWVVGVWGGRVLAGGDGHERADGGIGGTERHWHPTLQ
jgi:hypothetical protein